MRRDWAGKEQYRGDREQQKKGYAKLVFIFFLAGLIFYFSYTFFFQASEEPGPEAEIEVVVEEDLSPSKIFRSGRGKIYDRNLKEMAVSLAVTSIFVKPLEFDNIEKTVGSLAEVLKLDEQELLQELKTQRSFKWLAKNIFPEKAQKVAELNLKGVYFYEQEERFYPYGTRTAHIIGEVKDGHGLSGIEFFYDPLLSPSLKNEDETGSDLVLTLDVDIQRLLEEAIKSVTLETMAKGNRALSHEQSKVSALLLDATSGEILAYTQMPLIHSDELGGELSEADSDLLDGAITPGRLSSLFEIAAAYNEGRDVLADDGSELKDIRLLQPRTMKKMRVVKRKADWAKLPDGSYSSVWLSDIFSDQGVHSFVLEGSSAINSGFIADVDSCRIDLPGKKGGAGSGVGLLTGFAGLVNGGRIVCPHFLKSTLVEAGSAGEKENEPAAKNIITQEASHKFVGFVQEAVQPERSAIVAEVVFEAGGDVADQRTVSSGNVDVEKQNDRGQQKEDLIEENVLPVLERCSAVVLAAGPFVKPELVMLLAMDNGRIDLSRPSPFRSVATSFLHDAVKMYDRSKNTRKTPASLSAEKIFEQWKSQGESYQGIRSDSPLHNESMVDLKGKSLRSALQILNLYDVKVMVEGSGVVKHQHPAPGSAIKENMVVIIKAETVK